MKYFVLTLLLALSSKVAALELVHKQPEFPAPELPTKLSVEVAGTRIMNQKMRLVALIDGRVFDQTLPEGPINIYERPTYTFTIHSPGSKISYRFYYTTEEGTILPSKWFEMKRKCIPYVPGAAQREPAKDSTALEKLSTLNVKAQQLEREIQLMNQAADMIEELKRSIDKKADAK